MTLTEQIIAFSGTGVGSLVIGWWINKKKDDIEVTIKEQTFYKTLITDIEDQRKKERDGYQDRLDKMSTKISDLKVEVKLFLEKVKEKDKTIENQKENLAKWEFYCEQLKNTVESERTRNTVLDSRNEELERENDKLRKGK